MARSAALLDLTVEGAELVGLPPVPEAVPAGELDATSFLPVATAVVFAVPVATTALVVLEGYWLA